MITFVLVILLDYEFAGKKDIDFSMLDERFKTLKECESFEKSYIKQYNNIRGSSCIKYTTGK